VWNLFVAVWEENSLRVLRRIFGSNKREEGVENCTVSYRI
jgi:hypothetical protein